MANQSSQLSVAHFKPNSFIMVEGKYDQPIFYIIRSGRVQLQKETELIAEESDSNILNLGDFFGVISTMSDHARIESAIALSDVSTIVVRHDQFGMLIQKNAPIALKIIRSFSLKLRFFDTALTRMSFASSLEENTLNLYAIAEYYLSNKDYSIAAHAYQKYIECNPNGEKFGEANVKLGKLKNYVKPQESNTTGNFARSYQDKEVIFLEHEVGHELYIIQQGKIKITKVVNNNEILLAVVGQGDIFGEMAILDNKPRSASAISFGNSVMLAINKENFKGMVIEQPQLATKIITLLSERIWISYRQFANHLILDPTGRIFDTLLTQLQKNRIPIEKKKEYQFDFGTDELLNMVSLDKYKGKEALRVAFENPKIYIDNNKIITTDTDEIQKQVQFYKKQADIYNKIKQSRTR